MTRFAHTIGAVAAVLAVSANAATAGKSGRLMPAARGTAAIAVPAPPPYC